MGRLLPLWGRTPKTYLPPEVSWCLRETRQHQSLSREFGRRVFAKRTTPAGSGSVNSDDRGLAAHLRLGAVNCSQLHRNQLLETNSSMLDYRTLRSHPSIQKAGASHSCPFFYLPMRLWSGNMVEIKCPFMSHFLGVRFHGEIDSVSA